MRRARQDGHVEQVVSDDAAAAHQEDAVRDEGQPAFVEEVPVPEPDAIVSEPDVIVPDPDVGAWEQEVLSPVPPALPSVEETLAQGYDTAMQVAVQRARSAVHRILDADEAALHDRSFLLSCVLQSGLAYKDWRGLAAFTEAMNPVDYGMLQVPTEYTDYLLFAGASRPASAIEIGVYRGATAYFAAAYLSRLNPGLVYTAVDVVDQLVDFEYFAAILPIVKAAPATSGHFAGQSFDLAFIDGSHSYDDSRRDWLHVGRSSSVVAFHDINGAEYDSENGGIRRTWAELKLQHRTTRTILEISHVSGWMGIGMVFNTGAPRVAN